MKKSVALLVAGVTCGAALLGSPVSSAVDVRPAGAAPVTPPVTPSVAPVARVALVDDAVAPVHVRGLPRLDARAGVPGRTHVLVLRIYWSGQAPKSPSDSQMRGLMKQTAAWFKRVSRGRHHLTSKVTPWLKVGGGSDNCASLGGTAARAVAAARHRGIGTGSFNRFMVVSPQCASTSFGEKPGRVTWIREAHPYEAVLVHELGHNLGLDHANSFICTADKRRVTQGGKCFSEEYGDMWDAMGLSSRSYSVGILKRLGWAGRIATTSGSGTWTLRDAEHSGSGLQGLQVKVGQSSYWLEYRTNPVALDDSGGTFGGITGTPGLQIRLDTGARSLHILDAAPGKRDPNLTFPDPDFVSVALPVGSSFTTPQRVRITLLAQTATTATVKVTRNVKPRAPEAPRLVSVVTTDLHSGYVRVSIVPGADNGQVILGYLLTKYPGGKTEFVADPGGTATSYEVADLGGGNAAWTARAVNQVGTSPESAKTLVHVSGPVVSIVSPAPGAQVPGPSVPVSVTATPDAITQSPVTQVEVCLAGGGCQTDKTAPFAVSLTALSGADTITATAYDAQGGRHSVAVPVTVVDSPPTVHIDSPADTAGVNTVDAFTVAATATPNPGTGAPIVSVGFTVFDAANNIVAYDTDYVAPYASSLNVYQDGTYRIEAYATDANQYSSIPSVIHVTATTP